MEQDRVTADTADGNSHGVDDDSGPVPPDAGSARKPGRFRGWRGWLLRIALAVASPILFFSAIEAGLRLAGCGYRTSFFLGPDASGVCWTNEQFGWRFFPRSLARTPEPCRLPAKEPGTVRIFVLGSSAAMGMPNPGFNFGRILEVMLRAQYPNTRFEVVNAAMTAINSYVVREIAGDCAGHGADIFVVYMGNNEVVGPYGPGTVFQQWSRRLAMVRFAIGVKSTRVGQWLDDALARYGRDDNTADTWHGMEMFLGNEVAEDDPRLSRVYDNFRSNLTDICTRAQQAGAAVILSTVAVNLNDCPPLASLHRADLSAEDLALGAALSARGLRRRRAAICRGRIELLNAAAQIDDRYAELPFRLGRCLAATGQVSASPSAVRGGHQCGRAAVPRR